MKFKLLLTATLIFGFLAKAQNLTDEELMGEWNTVSVEILNSEEVPQKEALKFIKDAFSGSKFNFKGNKVFKIDYGKTADDRMKELFLLDNQNWIVKNNIIKIGTENDGFSAMHITFQKANDKIYFGLPMMRLEMEKSTNDKPSKPKVIKSKKGKPKKVDYSDVELINKEIDESQVVEFKEAENPPLAPDCKSKWNNEKKRECTNKFIRRHIIKKFNVDLATEIGLAPGKVKIIIEFIIDKNGKAINITANGGPEVMNQNAIEVIGLLPILKPGTKDGKPINISYKMPLSFYVAN